MTETSGLLASLPEPLRAIADTPRVRVRRGGTPAPDAPLHGRVPPDRRYRRVPHQPLPQALLPATEPPDGKTTAIRP